MSRNSFRSKLEQIFETLLWNSRLVVLLAVVFSALSSIALFIIGSYGLGKTILSILPLRETFAEYESVLIGIISAVDLYLIAIVLLIFAFGIYELFISRIDVARLHDEVKILEIGSLDELKNKLLKVIVMVLIVTFFKEILFMEFHGSKEMLFLAVSILLISSSIYLIRKNEKGEE